MIANLMMRGWMQVQKHGPWRRLLRAAMAPGETQKKLLRRILSENRATEYGRVHGFDAISSYEEFARSVPVVSYEALRPYIDEQMRTGEPALTAVAPLMYARTSGTTGEPKYVPLVQEELRGQKRHTALLTYRQYAFDRRAFSGRLWVMAAAAEEGRLENGVPWGSASGFLYANMAHAIAAKYVIPPEIFAIPDNELKYRAVLRLALAERSITYLSTANPTTLTRLCSLANEYGPELANDIEGGGFGGEYGLSPEVARAMRKRLHVDSARAQELRGIFRRAQTATFADLWPDLRLVSTWTGGNCGVAVETARALLPVSTRIVELGYLSSEFRGSLTIDCETGAGLPTLQDYFFEFIEPENWDAGSRACHLLHQIEPGRDYYVIVTTPSGLYRYFINDIVRVTGHFGMTPVIRFMQKGKGVTNITGEKLYESHVVEALGRARKRLGIRPVFYLMQADVEQQVYRLYLELDAAVDALEDVAGCIDQALSELNDEYLAKRQSGRLKPVDVHVLKMGTGEAYRAHCIRQGQKEGQFKIVTLQYAHQCDFSFQSHLREG